MPDLGSFEDNASYKRTLTGVQEDFHLLKEAAAANPGLFLTGEIAYCADTRKAYMYVRKTAEWYPQQEES